MNAIVETIIVVAGLAATILGWVALLAQIIEARTMGWTPRRRIGITLMLAGLVIMIAGLLRALS